jgi:hypothetical protein
MADNVAQSDEREPQKKWDDWFAAFGPTTWSNWALAVLAFAAGLVGWFTLRAVRRQAETSSDTLRAISQQVTVALSDLKRGRPSLFIEEVTLSEFVPQKLFFATINLKNYGQNPALIEMVEGIMQIVYWSAEPALDYSVCQQRLSPRDIVGPGESFSIEVPLYPDTRKIVRLPPPDIVGVSVKLALFPIGMSAEDYGLLERGEARLVVYGRVRYRDFAEGRYVRGFWWETDDAEAKFHSKVVFKRAHSFPLNYDEEEEQVAHYDWFN